MTRLSGLLLHPTSLPGRNGIGEIGEAARRFVDLLADHGQSVWQMLPLHPTRGDGSPYSAVSSAAGNEQWIDLDALVAEGLLEESELAPLHAFDPRAVVYDEVMPARLELLARAARRFETRASPAEREAEAAFRAEHGPVWLDDYALFRTLAEVWGGRDWHTWPEALRRRDPEALARARALWGERIRAAEIQQHLFDKQWRALRAYAASRGVEILGDMPIYVAQHSVDVWVRPELFDLNPDGSPRTVAGCPPDGFSATGQRWGNPIYRWPRHAEEGFAWWRERLGRLLQLVDRVRIDHFRAFAAYWEIPGCDPTAENGVWRPAPGEALFRALEASLGAPLPVVAEDLGFITPDVYALRDRFGFPGMKVLQFELEEGAPLGALDPSRWPARSVAYVGTHDNATAAEWLDGARGRLDWIAPDADVWTLSEACLTSGSDLAVLQLQDVMGLGREGRMNFPGTAFGNWAWRFAWEDLDADAFERLAQTTRASGRAPAVQERSRRCAGR